ncbi:MAG: ATP-dependent protease [Lysobacteraceae bacterium]|nr:MAG: ATP-dependent protease [Xanthomonadaceae bacterium]
MDALPLFPLRAVLYPGGELRLRVFEPRYLDLVRECALHDRPFGACRMLDADADGPALPAAWGTEARIVDFDVDRHGLLGILTLGGRRFHVERPRCRDNGLVLVEVRWIPARPEPLRPEHALLAYLLERMLERAGGRHARAGPAQYDDAEWVGYRLCELLPLDEDERQRQLQTDCPHARLQRLLELLPDLG